MPEENSTENTDNTNLGKPEENAGADSNFQQEQDSSNTSTAPGEETSTDTNSPEEQPSAPAPQPEQEAANSNESGEVSSSVAENSPAADVVTHQDFIHRAKITIHDFVAFLERCAADAEKKVSEELTLAHVQIQEAIDVIKQHFEAI